MSDTKVEALKRLYAAITGDTCTGETVADCIDELAAYYEQDAKITAFSFPGLDMVWPGTIDHEAGTIKLEYNAGFTSVQPNITLSSGATVNPAASVATDFTNDVTYTVTSGDGDTKTYTVSVSALPAITAFALGEYTPDSIGTDGTIAISVPAGTAVTALTPTITCSSKCTVAPASGTALDFTNPVEFVVSGISTTKTYTVTVTVESE